MKRNRLLSLCHWRILTRRWSLLALILGVTIVLSRAANVMEAEISKESLLEEERTFRPILNARGEPSHMKYYERPNGELAVRYYDSKGKVDMPVPRHFKRLSEDRVIYELRYQQDMGGNWTERTALEILYHAVTEPPVRDESIFDHPNYHPKAALKQQQRQQYFQTSNRRTYQQNLHDNAIAAAAAHRAGNTNIGGQVGIPIVARKMDTAYGWLRDDIDICDWEGVMCGDFSATSQFYWNTAGIMTTREDETSKYTQREMWTCEHCPQPPPDNHVTKIELPYAGLVGTLPSELAVLRYLHRLDLRGNQIYGSLPSTLAQMEYLQYLDLTRNELTGTLTNESNPPSFPEHLKELWLGANQLKGTISLELRTPDLVQLDLSKNQLTGSLPRYGRKQLPKLKSLLLEDNQLTGKLPPKWIGLTNLEVIDVGYNLLNGTIPTMFGTSLSNLRDFNIVGNQISGTIPTELLKLTNLEALMLSENRLNGTLPAGDDTVPNRAMREPEVGYKWSQLSRLQYFHVSDNYLSSTIPPDIFYGVMSTILRYV